MGLMDRDYMRRQRSERPFTPPSEKSTIGWLVLLAIFLLILYGGFKVAKEIDNRAQAKRTPVGETVTAPAAIHTEPPPPQAKALLEKPSDPEKQLGSPQPGVTSSTTSSVTKCIFNGQVSYIDGTCPTGASASQVTIRANENRIAAVNIPVQAPTLQVPTTLQSPVIAPIDTAPSFVEMKTICAALDERITQLDSIARQPQSGQMQDWLREQRKQARDRQFRMRC